MLCEKKRLVCREKSDFLHSCEVFVELISFLIRTVQNSKNRCDWIKFEILNATYELQRQDPKKENKRTTLFFISNCMSLEYQKQFIVLLIIVSSMNIIKFIK